MMGRTTAVPDHYKKISQWKEKPIIIFGAGKWGDDAFHTLSEAGYDIKGFADNNPEKWNSEYLGLKILSPGDATNFDKDVCFLIAVSSGKEKIEDQLSELGVDKERIVFYSVDIDILLLGLKDEKWEAIKDVVIPTEDEDYCMGCGACVSVCRFGALELKPDEFGYYKPVKDSDKCVDCGMCEKVCPALNGIRSHNETEPALYAFYTNDEEAHENGSSGAFFPLISEQFIHLGGVVFGAAWNKDIAGERSNIWENGLYVEHTGTENIKDLHIFFKSKYMQSYLGETDLKVKNALESGRQVLFSGCPCQIAGLYSFLGKQYDNLYTIDLLCGNSSSAGFFQKYIDENFGKKIRDYSFRYKGGGNADCTAIQITYSDNTEDILRGLESDDYQRVYHDHTMCPVHCQKCKYHSLPRYGDVTIGDFWGYYNYDTKDYNSRGMSAVLINNEKGRKLLDMIPKDKVGLLKEVPLGWIGKNGFLFPGATNYSSKYRDRFYRAINQMTFSEAVAYALLSERR